MSNPGPIYRGAIKSGPGSSLKFPHITANFKTAEDVEAGTHTPVHIVITNPEAEPDVDFIIDIEKSEVLPGGQPDKLYPVSKKAEVKGESVHSDADEDGSWESDSDTEVRLAKDEGNNTGCFMATKVLTYKGVTQKGQAEHGTEVPLVPKS